MGKRLTPSQWGEIGLRYTVGREPAKLLAREFGITAGAIYKRSALNAWPIPDGSSSRKVSDDLAATVVRLERILNRLEAVLSVESSRES